MNWNQLTVVFIIVTTSIILIYDLVAYLKGGIPATISSRVIENSKIYPIIPFLFGLLCGHLFT